MAVYADGSPGKVAFNRRFFSNFDSWEPDGNQWGRTWTSSKKIMIALPDEQDGLSGFDGYKYTTGIVAATNTSFIYQVIL
jgi:hypothetical protein